MKAAGFEYSAPGSLDAALGEMADRGGRAKALAGGQSLVPMLNLRLAFPDALVDLNRIHDLAYVERRNWGIAVGAMTRQRDLERARSARDEAPLLCEGLRHLGHFQIRNRGTVGGSLAHGDPAAELPALLLATDGHVVARSRGGGERTIGAAELFKDRLVTSLRADEILTEVFFPDLPSGAGWGFHEFARRHGDPALAGAAAVVAIRGGQIEHATLAVQAAASTPMRAPNAERILIGMGATDEIGRAVEETVREEVRPVGNVHGSAEYRRHLTGVVARRAVVDAAGRARR